MVSEVRRSRLLLFFYRIYYFWRVTSRNILLCSCVFKSRSISAHPLKLSWSPFAATAKKKKHTNYPQRNVSEIHQKSDISPPQNNNMKLPQCARVRQFVMCCRGTWKRMILTPSAVCFRADTELRLARTVLNSGTAYARINKHSLITGKIQIQWQSAKSNQEGNSFSCIYLQTLCWWDFFSLLLLLLLLLLFFFFLFLHRITSNSFLPYFPLEQGAY